MKKYIFFVLLVFATNLFAAVTITMEQSGGVYKVPCKVNGAKMKFIFDTGASNVSLSPTIVEYLLDNDYLHESDFIGTGQSVVADGSIVDNLSINIQDFEIAGMHLKNVSAIVTLGQQAPLLLGQSVIQRLGKVTINGDKIIVHSANEQNDIVNENTQIDDFILKKRIELAQKENDTIKWRQATENYYVYLWKNQEPKDSEFLELAKLYWYTHDINNAQNWLQRIKEKDYLEYNMSFWYYYIYANYYYESKEYGKALFFYTKARPKTGDNDLWVDCRNHIVECEKRL